jgi:hypothetical protein
MSRIAAVDPASGDPDSDRRLSVTVSKAIFVACSNPANGVASP